MPLPTDPIPCAPRRVPAVLAAQWRGLAGALLGLCLVAPAALAQGAATAPATPEARAEAPAPLRTPTARAAAEPFTETRHGTAIDDPWRWMERPEREADMKAWLQAASAEGMRQLAAVPDRAEWLRIIQAAHRTGTRWGDLQEAGGRQFVRRTLSGESTASLVLREGGRERVLFDPAKEKGLAINTYAPAPDGRTVGVLVSKDGGEVGEMRFIDVASGREVGRRFGPMWGEYSAGWLDGRRVLLTRLGEGESAMRTMATYLTTLGADPVPVLGPQRQDAGRTEPPEFPHVFTRPGERFTLGAALGARVDKRLMITPTAALLTGKPAWRTLFGWDDQVTDAALHGDDLYVLTTKDEPRGQIVHLRLAADGAITQRRVLHEDVGQSLTGVVAARDGLFVTGTRDGRFSLRFIPYRHGVPHELSLPFDGSPVTPSLSGDGRHLLLGLTGWTRPTEQFRSDGRTLRPVGLASGGWEPARGFVVLRDEAVSADGTTVPMVIVRRDGRPGAQDVLLEAYGSYGMPTLEPWYQPAWLAWVGRGRTLALCGTRGGNERGRAWHEGGRAANKPAAQADYTACAERLVKAGHTTAGRIAATGTSAGGLLSPVAAVQRPDLFGALLPRVGIVNATRLEAMDNGPNQYAEMGDPRTPEGWKALLAQDALMALQRAPRLPDILVTTGLNDRRVAPWQSAKYAAAAMAHPGAGVVMVRADAQAGHGIGSLADVLHAEFADSFTFLSERLATRR